VLAGVVEEVAEDPLEPPRVGLDDEPLVGQLQDGVAMAAADGVADEPARSTGWSRTSSPAASNRTAP
jgi:hypothetical protein